jgi:hypothetical protein
MNKIRMEKCSNCNNVIRWKASNGYSPKSKYIIKGFNKSISLGKIVSQTEDTITYSYHCNKCETENFGVVFKNERQLAYR